MKIHQYGTVTVVNDGPIKVEGWLVEREPEDPANATTEQLTLGFAIHWAKEKFDAAVKSEVLEVFRANARKAAEGKTSVQ
jgi:hypothetical protein